MRDGFVMHTAEGVLGGALGTLLIKQTMALGRRMPEKLQPVTPSRDPAQVIVSRLEGMRGRPFSWRVHDRVAEGLHWAYGIGWGGLLGLAVSGLHMQSPRRTLLAGAGMGALVWAVENVGVLPRAGMLRPIHRQGVGHVATSLAQHVAYGVAASVPILVIDRLRAKRKPWWSRAVDNVLSSKAVGRLVTRMQ